MFSGVNRWNNRVNTSWVTKYFNYIAGGGTIIDINIRSSRIQN